MIRFFRNLTQDYAGWGSVKYETVSKHAWPQLFKTPPKGGFFHAKMTH